MKKILIHTFVSVLITVGVLFFLFLPQAGGVAVLMALLTLFAAPFPTYIAILVYRSLQKKLFPHNKLLSSFAAILILLVIYHICFLGYVFFSDEHSLHTFRKEYASTIPAYLLAISIPVAELIIAKVERDMKAAR